MNECCQCKQLQTSPAATMGHREVRAVEAMTSEHTRANFCTMVVVGKFVARAAVTG